MRQTLLVTLPNLTLMDKASSKASDERVKHRCAECAREEAIAPTYLIGSLPHRFLILHLVHPSIAILTLCPCQRWRAPTWT
eukprot:scaffold177270_cov30-Tisochrysis_lutea.AAC.3